MSPAPADRRRNTDNSAGPIDMASGQCEHRPAEGVREATVRREEDDGEWRKHSRVPDIRDGSGLPRHDAHDRTQAPSRDKRCQGCHQAGNQPIPIRLPLPGAPLRLSFESPAKPANCDPGERSLAYQANKSRERFELFFDEQSRRRARMLKPRGCDAMMGAARHDSRWRSESRGSNGLGRQASARINPRAAKMAEE